MTSELINFLETNIKNQRGKKTPRRTSTEYQECKAFWEYAQLVPNLRNYLIKIANERTDEVWYIKSLLRIGLRSGLPDYYYPLPNKKYFGLWIEMKRANGKTTNNQEEWIDKLNKIGHYACIAHGAMEAIDIFNNYINDRL